MTVKKIPSEGNDLLSEPTAVAVQFPQSDREPSVDVLLREDVALGREM